VEADNGEMDSEEVGRIDKWDNGDRNKNSDNDWKNFNMQEFLG